MLFALVALIVLCVMGLHLEELRWSHVGLCILLAIGGLLLFAHFRWPPLAYTVVLAAIDIVLILVVFKGDIRIR
jgi:hypothetical protein